MVCMTLCVPSVSSSFESPSTFFEMSLISRTLQSILFNLKVHRLPDRQYLTQTMLPRMADAGPRHVLLAGTRRYTSRYPKRFDSTKTSVWTLDFDPSAARWGNGKLHRTCDICSLDGVFGSFKFDVIHINGLLGFGVDEPPMIKQMVESVHRNLIAGGHMMLGWDADRTADPTTNSEITSLFEHHGYQALPSRHSVGGIEGHAHVFDWFRRRDA